MTAEQRLTAFFTAIQPHMEACGVSAAIISVTGYDANDTDGFVCATRIGQVGPMVRTDVLQHIIKMHDDVHEVLNAVADKLEGRVVRHKPQEWN